MRLCLPPPTASRLAVLLAICLAAPAAELRAQDSAFAAPRRPYATLRIGAFGAHPLAPGSIDRYWDVGSGGGIAVHTPFHAGDIGAFVTVLPYRARTSSQPDFRAYVIGLDWRVAPPPDWRVRPIVSVNVGDFLTTFENVQTKGLAKESEIFFGGTAGLDVRVSGSTSVTAAVTGIQVLTSTPIRTAYGSVGVAHDIGTPRWLRRVIE